MSNPKFNIETLTELGIGTAIVIARVCARWKIVGIRHFRVDDYLIVVALVSWDNFRRLS